MSRSSVCHCLKRCERSANADVITVGPGSLYTSILPNLLVAKVSQAIGESQATKIFICNLMTQPGETDNYSARQHLETVKSYAPEIHFDFVVVNDRRITPNRLSVMHLKAHIKLVLMMICVSQSPTCWISQLASFAPTFSRTEKR